RRLLHLHSRGDTSVDCRDSSARRLGLSQDQIRAAIAARPSISEGYPRGTAKFGRGTVELAVVLSVGERVGHCRLAAAVSEPTVGNQPGDFVVDVGAVLAVPSGGP